MAAVVAVAVIATKRGLLARTPLLAPYRSLRNCPASRRSRAIPPPTSLDKVGSSTFQTDFGSQRRAPARLGCAKAESAGSIVLPIATCDKRPTKADDLRRSIIDIM